MEMDLAPFFGNVFDIVLFGYNAILSSMGIFVWLHNKKKVGCRKAQVVFSSKP